MMRYIKIEKTEDSPEVVLDAKNGTIQITGISFPKDIDMFYDPVVGWIEHYVANPAFLTEIIFKLDYFNTASSRKFLELLFELEKLVELQRTVIVRWMYPDDDDDIKSAGIKFSSLTKLTFKLEKY